MGPSVSPGMAGPAAPSGLRAPAGLVAAAARSGRARRRRPRVGGLRAQPGIGACYHPSSLVTDKRRELLVRLLQRETMKDAVFKTMQLRAGGGIIRKTWTR